VLKTNITSNRFPHSTFNWIGIDGTQVLCHMTPVGEYTALFLYVILQFIIQITIDTYTAQATVGDVLKGLSNHKVCSFYHIL
jgi:alpha-mannosidase